MLGVNGAGKTTTIKMLTTMIAPSEGEIFIDGIDAVKDPMRAKRKINIITGGERNIYWRLTAMENLQYFGRLYGINEKLLNNKIYEVLDTVELTEMRDVVVEKFSKGMKQRLQIARGLINNADYLFLDEPTLGLDVIIAAELRNYIQKLARDENKGILLTTHYIFEAEELCDYIYIIDNGKIIAEGSTSKLKEQHKVKNNIEIEVEKFSDKLIPIFEEYRNDKNITIIYKKEKNIIEIKSEKDINKEVVDIINKSKCQLKRLHCVEPTLEDVLLEILGG